MADSWFGFAGRDHFWVKRRFELIVWLGRQFFKKAKKYLDIGCGEGVFQSMMYSKLGLNVDGCDLNIKYLEKNDAPGNLYYYDIFDNSRKFKSRYDFIFILDVLEHVKNDLQFIQCAKNMLKKGGYILINVPAFNSLYSKYDSVAGHQKRYNRGEIIKLCTASQLKMKKMTYWGSTFLPILILRKILLMFVSNKNVIRVGFESKNSIINRILFWLIRLEITPNPYFGTSFLCLLKK